MAEPVHSLERGVADLTLQLNRNFSRGLAQYDELGLQEVAQQYQVDVVASENKWGHIDIWFESPFVYAPTRRHNSLVYPHASFMVYAPVEDPDTGDPLTPSDALPAVIDPIVTHYYRNEDSDTFYGARLFVAVRKVGSDPDNPVAASIHVTFQGYANWDEDESDL